ncbi:MAG TPA: N-acetyltransferase [Planctomycetaceae bacterium]|nr:N-acetyltransferase [Planctomycetaceae bacterium]
MTGKSLGVTLQIRAETVADYGGVHEVIRLAFSRDDEASLVDALRGEGVVRNSFVADIDGQIVGHLLFSELLIVGESVTVPALALAPLAVLPDYQRRGIGTRLTQHGLDACQKQGHRIIVVLGHPEFYRRFGFSSELAARLDSAFSGKPSFMALELAEGALDGVSGKVRYPAAFGVA